MNHFFDILRLDAPDLRNIVEIKERWLHVGVVLSTVDP